MAKYRQIQTCFWKDSFVTELTPEEKFFFMYLMTNANTTQCGIYSFIVKFAEVETGYNRETIEKLLKRFVEYGKISYCEETKELMILNWVKYNYINNKPVISCINKELREIKHKPFIKALYDICLNNNLPVDLIFKGIFNAEQNPRPIGAGDKSNLSPIGHDGDDKSKPGEEEKIEEEKEVEEYRMDDVEADDSNLKEAVESFNNNIHPITPIEQNKITDWSRKVETGVIILAVEEAVKHNARSFVYIERILNNWHELGYKTVKAVQAYKADYKKDSAKASCLIPNAKAYELFEEEEL